MLYEQLRDKWHARECAVPIHPIMTFTPRGLVLGAGTILLPADGARRLRGLKGQEARVLALLSTVYGKAVSLRVLGNIERAAQCWSDGNDCLAYIRLAHAGLPAFDEPRSAACRLFVAESVIKAGASPRAVLQALQIGSSYIDALEKFYNAEQPRTPAGNGLISGRWTRLLSWLGDLNAAEVAELGAYASRVLGPVGAATATFGLLFIPSPNNVRVEGNVPEIPGLRYSWDRDESRLYLTYDDPAGGRSTLSAYLDGDVFRDEKGQIIGHVVGGNRIVIDVMAILPDLVKENEPKLCPAPAPDRPGSDRGKPYEEDLAKQYEDFVKRFINPPPIGPTPSGFVYYLPNPESDGDPVSYDDCQKATGILFEIKGRYGWSLNLQEARKNIEKNFLDQSGRQVAASGGRQIIWIFAEREAAEFARKLFDGAGGGRKKITVVYVTWTRGDHDE